MNQTIEQFTRAQIKDGLSQLTEAHHLLFKRMYSHKNLELPIDEVVDAMPVEKLDLALSQVERTLNKINKSTLT